MNNGWIKLIRSNTTEELFKDKNACVLLLLIAYRAKRTNEFDINNLQIGEALIGDHKSCGLTQREYRTAKKNLEKWGFAVFSTTNKGTIAKLINSNTFDINIDKQNDKQTAPKQSINSNTFDINIKKSDNQATSKRQTSRQTKRQANDKQNDKQTTSKQSINSNTSKEKILQATSQRQTKRQANDKQVDNGTTTNKKLRSKEENINRELFFSDEKNLERKKQISSDSEEIGEGNNSPIRKKRYHSIAKKVYALAIGDKFIFETLKKFPTHLETNREFEKAWTDFVHHMRQMKSPMSYMQVEKLIIRLEEYSATKVVEMINFSISNGWKGIFESKTGRGGKLSGKLKSNTDYNNLVEQTELKM